MFFLTHAVTEFAYASIAGEIFRRDLRRFDIAFQDLAKGLTRQPGQFALQRADAGLPRVIADKVADGVLSDRKFLFLQAMRLNLLGQQMAFGDLNLLVFCIAFEPDDLHAVEQRLRQIKRVGRSEEHTSELQSLMRISY